MTSIAFNDEAADRATEASHGYPFLIQLIGYLAWNAASQASETTISSTTVDAVLGEAITTMGTQVHDPAVRALSQRQLEYLHALADIADEAGTATSGAIAHELKTTTTSLSEVRARLLEQGLIDAPRHGTVALALPYLRDYLHAGGEQTYVD
ncbi:hypothetical protein ACGLFO_11860 [Corynebacterium hesseae]|uniref:hypothetical protein n=1 Tax=Corynebacterium hesseae TaxID=2913502 RepID=UPI00373E2A6F